MKLSKNESGRKKKTPAKNKRLEPVKDVNSKQKQQNFNLWAIMQQVKQSCRLELGDNREFRPGAFNQWTSSVSDPNLNDISDRSFAETLISGGMKKGLRPEGISTIYGKKYKYKERKDNEKRLWETMKNIIAGLHWDAEEEKAGQIVMGLQSQ